ncbi:hypothetical protein KP509_28G004400 [Ceratopteris richardii]|uniref:RING-type E3 ubiquitin transferase n=1 Tax=Ceratopteris richardii TaxID=49495 RepID=A0A8T2R991_CERRI|nr:hypothetical protein KP509_28G004400 [Ceratopteris richardii]
MQHFWLPSMGVWAQVRGINPEDGSTRAAEHSHGFTSGTDHDDESTNLASSDTRGSSSRARVHERTNRGLFWSFPDRDTGGDEGYQDTNNRERGCSDDHMQNECHHYDSNECCRTCDESLPSCPICLSSFNLRKVAILRWCMHRFCLPCIEKWSSMQQFCPLCKQTFRGWYYDIQSSSKFEKRDMTIRSNSNHSNRRRAHGTRQRVFWNSNFRSRYSVLRPRTFKSLPRIRTFGAMSGHGENIREVEHLNQALQWRSHIYKRNLRAVPLALNSRLKTNEKGRLG